MPLTPKTQEILRKLNELNPDSEFILMNEGKPLSTVTYNRYLKKCCKNAGIPYRCRHKIRFSVASALYAKDDPATKLQKLLWHSTLAMTLHYLRDITPGNDCYEPMVDILD